MKLLFICARLPYPPNRGDTIRVFNLQKCLHNLGAELTVLSPYFEGHEEQLITPYKKELPLTLHTFMQKNTYLRYLKGMLKNEPLTLSYFFNSKLNQELKKILTNQVFDAIICTNCVNIQYVINNQKYINPRTKIIIDHMDLDSDKWQQYADRSSLFKRWIYKRETKLIKTLEKAIPNIANYSTFTSIKEVELYAKFINTPEKLKVIANGINTDFFTPSIKNTNKNKPVFLFTGVMDYLPNEQGVLWFIETVWPHILKLKPQAKFYIVGMHPTKKIQQLSKIQGVTVTGFVEDIRAYYKLADIYIAPLSIARGIQNKVLEAFATNTPVISTPNAIQGIECQIEKHLLIAEKSDEFVQQITALLDNASLRVQLSKSALALINEKYSWEAQGQKLHTLIKS